MVLNASKRFKVVALMFPYKILVGNLFQHGAFFFSKEEIAPPPPPKIIIRSWFMVNTKEGTLS
jgi:hypothetical protein